MANQNPKIMKSVFRNFLMDMKTVYTQGYFLPEATISQTFEQWYSILCGYAYTELKDAFAKYASENTDPPMPSSLKMLADQARRESGSAEGSPLDGFILWGVFDRKTGKKVCQDILADRKFSNVDILKEVTAKVGDGDYTVRRIG